MNIDVMKAKLTRAGFMKQGELALILSQLVTEVGVLKDTMNELEEKFNSLPRGGGDGASSSTSRPKVQHNKNN